MYPFDSGYPGCPSSSPDNDAIIRFLRDQPEDVIAGLALTSNKVAPISDGHLLPTNYQELYASGEHISRSIILGCNNDEGQSLWNYMAASLKAAGIAWNMDMARPTIQRSCLRLTTDSEAAECVATAVMAEYLPEGTEDSAKAIADFFTDAYFISTNVSVANQCSRMYSNWKTVYFRLTVLCSYHGAGLTCSLKGLAASSV